MRWICALGVVLASCVCPAAAVAARAPAEDGRVAYTRYDGPYPRTSLWTVAPDGGGAHLVIGGVKEPAFSPDGRRIVYARGDALFGARADGSTERRLTDPDYTDFNSSYSPDGRLITFQRGHDYGEDPGHSWIYVMRSDGSHARRLTPGHRVVSWDPRFSPDSDRIVWSTTRSGQFDLMTIAVDGSGRRRLTSTEHADERDASFSPRGRRIVFTRSRSIGRGERNVDVYTMNADGSNVRRLTRTREVDETSPVFSPDGRSIAFESAPHTDAAIDPADIAVMRGDGSNRRRLTSSSDDEFGPHYSPTGSRLVYTRYRGNGDVFLVRSDGSHRRRLTATAESETASAWLPRRESASR